MSDIKIEASTAEPIPVSTSTPVDQTTTLSATLMDTSPVNDSSASKDATSTPAPRSCTRNVASTKKQQQQPKPTPTLPVVKAKPAAQPKAAKTPAAHPPFFEMIIQAIRKLNDRAGSSRQAILKFITANFKVTEKQGNQHVKIGLKNAVKAGTLKQVKGVGASGSFKLSDALKTKEKGKDNKKASGSKAVAVASKPVKKTAAKKVKKASAVGVAKLSVAVGKKATKEVKKSVKAKKASAKETVAKPVVARARAGAETAKKAKPAAASKAVAKSKTKSSPTINRKAKTTVQAKKNGRSSRK